jgi:uncharacterized protein YbjT (DUF2867 family)
MAGTTHAQAAIVTGATGQDGLYLVRRLLAEGWLVYASVRDTKAAERLFGQQERLVLSPPHSPTQTASRP